VPEGWVQVPPGEMQNAAFAVDANDPKLIVSLSTFGMISPVLSNVVRWEGQLGLPASTADDLSKVVVQSQNNGLEIDSVDLKSPPPADGSQGRRMLASIIASPSQQWFLKFSGPASKIEAHKSQYDAFLKSISLTQTPAPVATPTPATPTQPGTGTDVAEFSAYTLPPGWTRDPQEHAMRLATFKASDGAQSADVIITMLSAQFGSPEANLTRWHGEVGLGPVDDASKVPSTPVKVGGVGGLLFDFTSANPEAPDAKQAVIAEVIKDNHSFFFKLIGPAKLVEQQKKSFDSFLQSVQFASN
jgi:hypothetical protein